MIEFSSKYRSKQVEIMDDLQLKGDEMKSLLTDLGKVNRRLGGNSITINGVKRLLKGRSKNETIRIIDLGCGDGAILRKCAAFGKANGFNFQLIGIDANPFILEEARNRSEGFQNINYIEMDIFSEEFKAMNCDIVLCTLFLHHFTFPEIIKLMTKLVSLAKVGIVVNDLQRSIIAFWLFRIFSQIFLKTSIAKHDGLVSVARGFRKNEIVSFSEKIGNTKSHINWKWAFRYQWVINNNK